MAKKIKFPLEMKDGVKVRTLEELQQHFDAEKILMHFMNGKLMLWLSDRHYDDHALELKKLDGKEKNLLSEICSILGIQNDVCDNNININIAELESKKNKIMQIKQYTDEEEVLKNIDLVAMNQAEFNDLISKSNATIYLLGDKFKCPASIKNVIVEGINTPEIEVNSNHVINFKARNVVFRNIKFDAKYQALIDKKKYDEEHNNGKKNVIYKASTLFNVYLSDEDRAKSKNLYMVLQNELSNVTFDEDIKTSQFKSILLNADLYDKFDINTIGKIQRNCLKRAHLNDAFYEFCIRNDFDFK